MHLGRNISYGWLLSQLVSVPSSCKRMPSMMVWCVKKNFKKDTDKAALL